MNLNKIISVIEKAKTDASAKKIIKGYEYCIKKIVEKYSDYYYNKEYAREFKSKIMQNIEKR